MFVKKVILLTAALAAVLLLLAVVGQVTLGKEIRIGTVQDLARAALGLAPTTGPDSGIVPSPGDILLISPLSSETGGVSGMSSGSISSPIVVAVPGIVIRASGGPETVQIRGTGTVVVVVGDNVTIEGLTISGGTIGIDASRAKHVKILKNALYGNVTGIRCADSEDMLIASNKILNNNIGIEISNTSRVEVSNNSIRHNEVGIEVSGWSFSVDIKENNISRNTAFGIDASRNSTVVKACYNWWGCPSGPYHPTKNPNGCGNRVSDNVDFCPPWIVPLPPPPPLLIIKRLNCPTTAITGTVWTCTVEVENAGTEERTLEIILAVKRKAEYLIMKSVTKTVSPGATTSVTFDYLFPEAGDYTIELLMDDEVEHIDVTVTSAVVGIESVCAQHSGEPNIINDEDILWCVGLWVRDEDVPGTGMKIDDSKMLELIEWWISGRPVAGSSVPESLESLTVDRIIARWHSATTTLTVQGSNIASVELDVFNLAGQRVFKERSPGNTVTFKGLSDTGRVLANGVYLYLITVQGYDGQVIQSEVRKLVILR
jgi:parallel beta-helix repeat protein